MRRRKADCMRFNAFVLLYAGLANDPSEDLAK